MSRKYDIVICGAGITGAAAAHFISKASGQRILLIDDRPPLSFTSDRSTECYRNWWPDPEMLALMNRSIDLMEQLADESGNVFHLNRRGYLYVTGDESKITPLEERSRGISSLGAGTLRIHSAQASSYQPAPLQQLERFVGQLTLEKELLKKALKHTLEKSREKRQFLLQHLPQGIQRGCELMNLPRSSFYYPPKEKTPSQQEHQKALEGRIEALCLEFPPLWLSKGHGSVAS